MGCDSDNRTFYRHVGNSWITLEPGAPVASGTSITLTLPGDYPASTLPLQIGATGTMDYGQGILTSSTPQFSRLGLGAAASATITELCYVSDALTSPIAQWEQASTGDAATRWALNGAASYAAGIDNSATGDPFKVSYGSAENAALGTNDLLHLTSLANLGIGGAPDVAGVGSTYDYWTFRSTTAENYGTLQLVGAKTGAAAAYGSFIQFCNNSGLGGTIHRLAGIYSKYGSTTASGVIALQASSNTAAQDYGAGSLTLTGSNGYLEHYVNHTGAYPFLHVTQAGTGDCGIDISIGSTRTYGIAIDNSETNDPLVIATAAAVYSVPGTNNIWKWWSTGNCQSGPDGAGGTGDTTGYFYVRACAGTPTGVPTAITGYAAMRYDSTNAKMYVYDTGTAAWVALN